MKLRSMLFALSLAANAVLLAAFVLRPAVTTAFFRDLFYRGSSAVPTASSTSPSALAVPPPAASSSGSQPLAWPEIAPGDFPALVARLRAAGFPPSLVQTAVTAAVEQHYAARRAALLPTADPAEYWKNSRSDSAALVAKVAAHRPLDIEQRKLLRELLGDDFYAAEDALHPDSRRRKFGDLPDEKVAALRRIFSDHDELTGNAFPVPWSEPYGGGTRPDEALEKKLRADIEHVLTPDELLRYDLLNSNAARGLRNRLGSFQATETEFRALYPAQKILSDLNLTRSSAPELKRQREEANQQVDAELRRVLGEPRYAEFQLVNDNVYQSATAFVARNNLPPTVAAPFAAIQKDAGARLAAINGNSDLTANQREAQLAAVAVETREKLATLLGPAGLASFMTRAGGGAWLNRYYLPPPPAAPVPTP